MKELRAILIFLFAILTFTPIGLKAQEFMAVTEVSDNLYAIINPQGGNSAFLVTGKGVVVVDAGSTPENGKQIVATIKSITNKSIKYLILTHMHGDHINGIAGFPDDIKIISHVDLEKNNKELNEVDIKNYKENIFPKYLTNLKVQLDSIDDKESAKYDELLKTYNSNVNYFEDIKQIKFRKPDITFEDYYRLKLADERIILEYPGPGHTNDNIIVKFSNHNVIHTGDIVFNKEFPYTITDHGVDIFNWVKILEDLFKENIKTVIPGHGETDNKYALKEQADYFKELARKIEELRSDGLNLEQIIEKSDINKFKLKGNENQFPINITVIYNQLINTKINWWEF